MRITLDGVPVLEDSPGGWAFALGTAPHAMVLEFPTDLALSLHKNGRPHQSVYTVDLREEGRGIETFKQLTILRVQAGRDRYHRQLVVCDRRWAWTYPQFVRLYNMRRRTGERRRLPNVPLAVDRIQDDVAFAPWSLKGETTRWTPREVLEDVLDAVAGEGRWKVESEDVWKGLQAVEDLDLTGTHDRALGRALAYFGLALQIFVEPDGTVVLFKRVSGLDRTLLGIQDAGTTTARSRGAGQGIQPLEPELVDTGGYAVLDRRRERPSKVVVHFERLLELRMDYVEDADGSTGTIQAERNAPPPRLDWVVVLPEDVEFRGRRVPLGTYFPGPDYLEFLKGKQPPRLPNMTTEWLRVGVFSSASYSVWAQPLLDPTRIWARRIPALTSSYRQMFQLREPWRSRIKDYRAHRVALLDIETNTQGPAAWFCDYAYWCRTAWFGSERLAGPIELQQPVRNMPANPAGLGRVLTSPLEAMDMAPASVKVVDNQLGVFAIDFRLDYLGEVAQYLPSAMDPATLPNHRPDSPNQWLEYGSLTESHQGSLVLTVVLGAPNDDRLHHKVTVEPDDVAAALEPMGGIGETDGPELHIRISPARSVARFGWDDARASQVYRALAPATPSKNDEDGEGEDAAAPDLQAALGDPINLEELEGVARAAALRVYTAYVDHIQGAYTTGFRQGVRPVGAADVSLDLSAGAITTVNWGLELPPLDEDALLPPGVRNLVRRMVDP